MQQISECSYIALTLVRPGSLLDGTKTERRWRKGPCRVYPSRFALVCLACSFLDVSLPSPARAQAPDPLEAAFADSMTHPSDPDRALRYAQLAARRGQTRAAIAALERVLRTNPRLDNIRLEIASLQLAAGSADVAALYAREALASPSIPPDVAARARQLLAQAEKGAARSLFEGSVFAGVRYDSNATQATALSQVGVFDPFLGIPLILPAPQRVRSDGSVVLNGQVSHRYDLGLQREGAWETNLSGFQQRFFQVPHAFDLTLGQFDTGPRIGVGEIGDGTVSVRPLFSANYLAYASRTYAWLYGGGVSAAYRLPPRLAAEVTALGRYGKFYDSGYRPRASDYSGAEWTLSAALTYEVAPALVLGVTAFYYDADARQPYNKRSGPGAAFSVAKEFDAGGYRFGTVARAGIRVLSFAAADQFIEPDRARTDTIVDAGVSATLPVVGSLSVLVQYDYIRNNSSYGVYRFDNHAVTAGLRFAF